jgi:ABC-type sugar transport system ATPase subunit
VTLLRLTGINKAFLGVQALSDVDFDLQAGEMKGKVDEVVKGARGRFAS